MAGDHRTMIGQTIGEYRILAKRGEGGMGIFYKAIDERLDRVVGIKTLRAELVAEPGLLDKLQAEAKTLARLDHPHIARLHHYLVIADQHYIVMEFVEGLDLSEMTRQSGLLPLDLLARLNRQMCEAFAYAHQGPEPVIHRDIKPSNILVTPDHRVKVTDFGIAKILGVSARTRTGMAAGSLPFMAPEQISSKPVDARTDIYQLGVTFFELTTGERPFKADSEYEMMKLHLEAPPPRPSSVNARVPTALDDVILKALAKKPEDRFQTALEFDAAVQDALSGDTDAPTLYGAPRQTPEPKTVFGSPPKLPSRSPEPPPRPPRRRSDKRDPSRSARPRVLGIAAGALGIVVVMIGVWWLWFRGAPEPPAPVTVTITARVPQTVPLEELGVITLKSSNLLSGQSRVDTVDHIGRNIEHDLILDPSDAYRFSILGADRQGTELFQGDLARDIPEGGPSQFGILLTAPEKVEEEPVDIGPAPIVGTVGDGEQRDTPPVPPTQTGGAILTIDIEPFNLRGKIDRLWIDDRRVSQPFSLPLERRTSTGVHTIRWQIGTNRWTDTVNVAQAGRTKRLSAGGSTGHLTIGAVLAGAPGDDPFIADIVIDGMETGEQTPRTLRNLPTGPHQITLRADCCRMIRKTWIVRLEGRSTDVTIEMTRR